MNRNGILRIGAAAAFALTMLSGAATAQQKSLKDQLVGTWTAVSNVQTRPDGSKLEPFTTNPKGAFMFAADGHFAFVLMRPDLPRLASNDRLKPTAEEAMAALRKQHFSAVLTDLKLPSGTGMDVLRTAVDADPALPVVIMTAYGSIAEAVAAMRDGAYRHRGE